MRVVCSWCRHEGRSGDLGEKAPFDDPAQTHAICARHLEQLLSTLPSPSCPAVDVLVASGAVSRDRRRVERRVRRGVSLPGCTLVRFKRRV
ncbi:MAG: hypothetical protein DME15_14015 [Candidatus Rokuibacteriota bacterium]|nr:MAG: hypothetical protein DME15_14015 [Candidatus Rokubacteria bacterium]